MLRKSAAKRIFGIYFFKRALTEFPYQTIAVLPYPNHFPYNWLIISNGYLCPAGELNFHCLSTILFLQNSDIKKRCFLHWGLYVQHVL